MMGTKRKPNPTYHVNDLIVTDFDNETVKIVELKWTGGKRPRYPDGYAYTVEYNDSNRYVIGSHEILKEKREGRYG